jgi:tetratricopeptide (TPR) repeat protein
MSEVAEARTVFISYSQEDKEWKKRLVPHLRTLEQQGLIDLWDDTKIDGGDTWYDKIKEAMNKADVALCLISADFLSSDFVNKEEVPFLLDRCERGGMLLLPVLVRPCTWKLVKWLARIQILPGEGQSIAVDYRDRYDEAFLKIAELICRRIENPAIESRRLPPPCEKPPEDHVCTEALPRTSSELFGRARELKLLDEAWESESTGIVSLVGWSGVGKSALVNKWLEQMGEDHYRGAKRIFGWSFSGLGAGQDAASADLFIDRALRWFGDPEMADSKTCPWDKGRRLAELIRQEKTLLLLDRVEPLQSRRGQDRGQIRDPALAALIRQLARRNPGLCVITTREPLTGVEAYKEFIRQEDVEQISAQAGRALLRVSGVRGTDGELEQITRDFGNHALSINLLAPYFSKGQQTQVSPAFLILELDMAPQDRKDPKSVVEALARRLGDGPEINVLRIMGLFDRPVTSDEIAVLRRKPAIPGLTDNVCELSDEDWSQVVHRLRADRFVAPASREDPRELDAHLLVRRYFAEWLRTHNSAAWREAHSRLYEHYTALPEKMFPDTLEEMIPLYRGIAHGCQSGRHQEALDEVYRERILRCERGYSVTMLGALGEDLTALAAFFDRPWSQPAGTLTKAQKGFVLDQAGSRLNALGRLDEAVEPLKAALEAHIAISELRKAAFSARALSQLFLTRGEVARSWVYASQGVELAKGSSRGRARIESHAARGDALHQWGQFKKAELDFREAERLQGKNATGCSHLYSLEGFWYCELLLTQGKYKESRDRAKQMLQLELESGGSLFCVALAHLALGRAELLAVLNERTNDLGKAPNHLDEAVKGFRKAVTLDHLPRALLARAELRRVAGQYSLARRDLDEAFEIAAGCGMRLHECDVHLECCQLILTAVEAGATLDEEDLALDRPILLLESACERLTARQHLEKAIALVAETDYHRRNPEVLIGTAHMQLLGGNKEAARQSLDEAEKGIREMSCLRWESPVKDLKSRL